MIFGGRKHTEIIFMCVLWRARRAPTGGPRGWSYASLASSYRKALNKLAAEGLVESTGWMSPDHFNARFWCITDAGLKLAG